MDQSKTGDIMGLKIEKLKNIIVSLERVMMVEVGKVVKRMEVVVVSEPKVVVEVQETQVEIPMQVQVQQQF